MDWGCVPGLRFQILKNPEENCLGSPAPPAPTWVGEHTAHPCLWKWGEVAG